MVELTDLDEADYGQLTAEILAVTRLVQEIARPDKTNVATLGNVVPQMHVHVIASSTATRLGPTRSGAMAAGPTYPPHTLAILADRYAKAARVHFQTM